MEKRAWQWSQLKPPLLPVRDWLPHYERRWLRPDLIVAAAVWAVRVPEGMAYASLAGLPPETGLFAALAPLLVYAVLGTCRQLTVGPSSAIAGLLGRRRGAAGGRRPRPLHRPVGAARPPRRRASSDRRPRPRRLPVRSPPRLTRIPRPPGSRSGRLPPCCSSASPRGHSCAAAVSPANSRQRLIARSTPRTRCAARSEQEQRPSPDTAVARSGRVCRRVTPPLIVRPHPDASSPWAALCRPGPCLHPK